MVKMQGRGIFTVQTGVFNSYVWDENAAIRLFYIFRLSTDSVDNFVGCSVYLLYLHENIELIQMAQNLLPCDSSMNPIKALKIQVCWNWQHICSIFF